MDPETEAREIRKSRALIEAAEQAANAEDFPGAERLLREAALLQENTLGPLHPQLANTLNNLGIVSEMLDRPADAEQCYRRAYAIAVASLEPTHPFVATSEKNLRDFCEARGKPINLPPAPEDAFLSERPQRPPEPTTSPRSPRPLAIALGIIAIVIVLIAATRPWRSADGRDVPPSEAATPVVSSPPSANTTPEPPISAPNAASTRNDIPVEAPRTEPAPRAATTAVTVAEAQLCQPLIRASVGDWQCDPAGSAVANGPLFFYTRLRSPSDSTVEHRWYRGERLQQAVELEIRANQGSGYRTFSLATINTREDDEWRVELVTGDGVVLHEERFTVR